MEKETIIYLTIIVGCFIALAGYLSGRDKKIQNDSEWKGCVNTKLDIAIGIRKDFDALDDKVEQQGNALVELKENVKSNQYRIEKLEKRKED